MAESRSEGAKKFLARSLQVSPGGAQTRSKRASVFPETFPVGLDWGMGSHVYDIEGRGYIDWICGLGAISLGYNYPEVTAAAMKQVFDSPSFSLPHYLEVETAELLLDMLKWPEQVRWVKTGSEATVGAMMIARWATGRDVILSIGYHGWHEAHQPSRSLASVAWGELEALKRAWEYQPTGSVAGVLLEACRDSEPPLGYLQGIQDLCRQHGALLIVDECVTGFRWAIGGASAYFGIQPDLACYGKGLANGYSLACIVGPGRLMAHAMGVSGTYGGEAVSLAACKATLEVYRKEPVIKHMWNIGRQWLASGLAEGYPCHPRLRGSKEEVWDKVARLASGGVLIHPAGFNVSYSHTVQDAQQSIEALQVGEK